MYRPILLQKIFIQKRLGCSYAQFSSHSMSQMQNEINSRKKRENHFKKHRVEAEEHQVNVRLNSFVIRLYDIGHIILYYYYVVWYGSGRLSDQN